MKAVILSGGSGTRLWPLSQQHLPKQFVQFQDEATMFQQTILRYAQPAYLDEQVIITNADFKAIIEDQLSSLELNLPCSTVCEPLQRNTAPAIALAAKFLETMRNAQPDDVLLILPSDHVLENNAQLWQQLALAETLAQAGNIVTFGITPTHPETGYGYIQIQKAPAADTIASHFNVERFTEKPDAETATEFVNSGRYFWNSGMFALSTRTLYSAFEQYAPEIHALLHLDYEDLLQAFALMPHISFDYAVMEHAQNCVVVPLEATWSDIGCWDSIYDIFEKDSNQNVLMGDVLAVESQNSLVLNKSGRLIATIGLEDFLVIDTPDALLIVKKGETQKVRVLAEAAQKRLHNTVEALEKSPVLSS